MLILSATVGGLGNPSYLFAPAHPRRTTLEGAKSVANPMAFLRCPDLTLPLVVALTLLSCENAAEIEHRKIPIADGSVAWVPGNKGIENYVDPEGKMAVVAYFTNAWDLPGRILEKTLDDEIGQIFDARTTLFIKYDCTDTNGIGAKVHSTLGPKFIPFFTSDFSGEWKFSPPLNEWFGKEDGLRKALRSLR